MTPVTRRTERCHRIQTFPECSRHNGKAPCIGDPPIGYLSAMNRMRHILLLVLVFSACSKNDPSSPSAAPDPQDTAQAVPDSLTEDNMLMGNPSNAVANAAVASNYLHVKKQYALSYNDSRGTANWVCWHLSSGWTGNVPRCDCFTPDYTLPSSFDTIATTHYAGSGFDRGHMCPSADRNRTAADNAATFLMPNIMPQAPALNQGQWMLLEDYCRTLKDGGQELYIYAGGFGTGGTGSQGGATTTIGGGQVTVQAFCWKLAVVLSVGSDDLNRVDANTRVITVCMPNTQAANTTPWGDFRISVDSLETLTGYDFLSAVDASVQAVIEAKPDSGPTQ